MSREEPTWGSLLPEYTDILSKVVRDRVVTDLGAGNLVLSRRLLRLGASEVVAVDHKPLPPPCSLRIQAVQAAFTHFHQPVDVAFLSWPATQGAEGLEDIVRRSRTVIYLGSNVGGNFCGTLRLFQALARKRVLHYVPHIKNTLIVLGEDVGERDGTGEELARLFSLEGFWSMARAEAAVSREDYQELFRRFPHNIRAAMVPW